LQESRRLNRRRAWPRSGSAGAAALLATVAVTAALAGGRPEAPPTPANFARDVMPVLGQHCEGCHGAREQHGGLRLDSYDAVMRGGDSGPVVLAGDASKSLLVAKIEHRDRPVMPPRKRLPLVAIARIRAWITSGAAP
jgi:hypothetical protein